jgi:hypothetical protein
MVKIIKNNVKKLRVFFEDNLTSYSYLFFAGAAALAYKGFFHTARTSPLPNSIPLVLWDLLSPLFFPVLFIIASFVTYKVSSGRFNNFMLYVLHIMLCVFIAVFAAV